MAGGSKDKDQTRQHDQRKARLAEALRANLLKRKAQTRSRRAGAADSRPEGLAGSSRKRDD